MIELLSITKSFASTVALDGLNLRVNKGEILGLLGPNGAGKTTTMKIITGFWHPTSGQVLVEGLDVIKKPEQAKRKIGYLPETVPLYEDMKVFEYLKFMAEMRDIVPDSLLTRIKEVAERCGLSKVIGQPIAQLSKGYKQRVGLAQAIVHDPDILILDEPTSGLDPNQIVEIRELIKEIGKSKTVIFSTHILAEAAATCDRVVIINQGRKVAEGTPDELVNRASRQVYYLELEADVQRAEALLAEIVGLAYRRENGSGAAFVMEFAEPGQKRALAAALSLSGLPIMEFSPRMPSLEEVFREITKPL